VLNSEVMKYIQINSSLDSVRSLFTSPRMRVYTTNDVVGVEVGGALKNIYAIAGNLFESGLLCSQLVWWKAWGWE
jgi:glycerol-3-phosphate dehydrogenase